MKILLLRTWITNIGNGFIDMGAKAAINKAFPDAEIIEVSGHPNLAAGRRSKGLLPDFIGSRDELNYGELSTEDDIALNRVVNVGELIDVDVAVLPGCVLYEHVLEKYYPVFERLTERNVPLILLGAGGGDYNKQTKSYVDQFINNVRPTGLITRDTKAYNTYEERIENTYDGIDCAFFINDWYEPPTANKEFDVSTFDKIDEPDIQSNRMTIRTDHFPFEQPYGNLWQKTKKTIKQWNFFNQENIFVSDSLKDYLFIYANSRITHSDRIHACVPTLAYGNRAKFWFDTPRGALFDKVIDKDIQEQIVSLDKSVLKREKERQVSALRDMIDDSI